MNREQDAARKMKAWDLRIRGFTYRQIGAEMSIGHETAHRWVKEVLDNQSTPLADEIRKQEFERLERYLRVLDKRIDAGDDKAVGLAIKVSESLRKMMGADKPTQVEVTQSGDSLDLAIIDLITAQEARNALAKERAATKSVVSEVEETEGESE